MGAHFELHLKNERKTKFKQLRVKEKSKILLLFPLTAWRAKLGTYG